MTEAGPIDPARGIEWIVDAQGCDPAPLRDPGVLRALFEGLVSDLGLHPVGEARFHSFPGPGGVTGLLLLSESHLTCHTYPETGYAAFNLYCCRPRPDWPWAQRLSELLGATRVQVRAVARPGTDERPS